MAKTTCVFGVDPGTTITGWGCITQSGTQYIQSAYGTIVPSKKATPSEKYLHIFTELEQLLDQHRPDFVSTETQYVAKNPQSALKLGMARGMVILAAARRNIPFFEYTPSKVKIAATGRGNATKAQVQYMVKLLLGLDKIPASEDASDALAIAITHAQLHKEVQYV